MNWENSFQTLSINKTDALPELMLSHLASWGTIHITGEDQKTYLQGQITCDVTNLDETQSTLSAHCDPKGKVWSVFRLFHHNDGISMFQTKSAIEHEFTELKKYAIFSKVELTESDDILLGVLGDRAEAFIDTLSNESGAVRSIPGGTAVKVSALRWLLVLDKASADSLIETFHGEKVSEDIWTRFDIEEATPIVTKAMQGQYIPQSLNVQALDGICFTKGCYTGQETVARAKYRGINKRAMFIVEGNITEATDTSEPLELERSIGDNWRSAGSLITQYVFNDNTATGLIILPNDLDSDVQLRIKSTTETHWTLQPLPYSLDDE